MSARPPRTARSNAANAADRLAHFQLDAQMLGEPRGQVVSQAFRSPGALVIGSRGVQRDDAEGATRANFLQRSGFAVQAERRTRASVRRYAHPGRHSPAVRLAAIQDLTVETMHSLE